ncbi:phage holin, lambda family [Serratia symbiotica]|uniref:phage holin, lambda family n=1 Tax=Serratia symbiotica TaxID=138074 RepID=UPI001CF06836|nr:phage holin, lambda family [Serratia symbiotica]
MNPNQSDFWLELFNQYSQQGIAAALAFVMAWLRSRYNGNRFYRTLVDSAMCALLGWFARDLLSLIGADPKYAYLGSVAIGYLGTEYFGGLLKNIVGSKTGVSNENKSSR